MRILRCVGLFVMLMGSLCGLAHAALLTDSVADYSWLQGHKNWYYGFVPQGLPTNPYNAGAFQLFDIVMSPEIGDPANLQWRASQALPGSYDQRYPHLTGIGGHPAGRGPDIQDRIILPVRRYLSPVSGVLSITYNLGKVDVVDPRGGGITGRIFVNGVEVVTHFIANTDAIGVQGTVLVFVLAGSAIDFVIDPTGIQPLLGSDDLSSARADESRFIVTISTARATLLTDSVADYAWLQGQKNWYYGFVPQGLPTNPYNAGAFQLFDIVMAPEVGNPLDLQWRASQALPGSYDQRYPHLTGIGGHPAGIGPDIQDRIILPVRRYLSPVSGFLSITYDLGKDNIVNPRGGGVTGRIFVDGVEVLTHFIDNVDAVGVQGTLQVFVRVGSAIDFVIDPTGIQPLLGSDDLSSARADASRFIVTISRLD